MSTDKESERARLIEVLSFASAYTDEYVVLPGREKDHVRLRFAYEVDRSGVLLYAKSRYFDLDTHNDLDRNLYELYLLLHHKHDFLNYET